MAIGDYEKQLAARVKAEFVRDTENHVVTQYHSDGDVGRIWKCGVPGSSFCQFWVSAPPGWLIIYGDMGECMWSRVEDMLRFVRGSVDSVGYFHEKSSRDCKTREHSTEMVDEWIENVEQEWEDDNGEPMSESESEILEELKEDWDGEDVEGFIRKIYDSDLFHDSECIPSFRSYTYHYLWQCEAVKWLVQQLDSGNYQKLDKPFEWN